MFYMSFLGEMELPTQLCFTLKYTHFLQVWGVLEDKPRK